jgi:hypothetical protein
MSSSEELMATARRDDRQEAFKKSQREGFAGWDTNFRNRECRVRLQRFSRSTNECRWIEMNE